VTDGPVPVDRLEIRRRRWHRDVIGARDIEGAIATNAQIGAGGVDQRLSLRQNEIFSDECGGRRDICGKIFALVGIEHRKGLEERSMP
jgi:hypothetical protein